LVNAEIDGDRLTDDELEHFLVILVTAATDTTAHGITNGVLALLKFPDESRRLCDNPALIDDAVEEMLRWGTPTMYFRRTATGNTPLGSKAIRKGDKVVMCYVAANRDGEVFEDPNKFVIDRHPIPHLSFGAPGPHIRHGAPLARAEIAAVIRELVTNHPDLRLDGPVERLQSTMLNGLLSLPVAFG
jgi:cytochrome P450